MKSLLLAILLATLFFSTFVHAEDSTLAPYSTDGCSAFIDRPIVPWGKSWVHCCVAHDFTYWRGGTKLERQLADRELVSCVNKTVGESDRVFTSFGWLMWMGIRLGGAPYSSVGGSPFSWRWGYGWNTASSYREITQSDKEKIMFELVRVQTNLPQAAADLALNEAQIQYVQGELYRQILHFTNRHRVR